MDGFCENNGKPYKNGWFIMENLQIIHFNMVFHYKPSILGYPYFWKHPNLDSRWFRVPNLPLKADRLIFLDFPRHGSFHVVLGKPHGLMGSEILGNHQLKLVGLSHDLGSVYLHLLVFLW